MARTPLLFIHEGLTKQVIFWHGLQDFAEFLSERKTKSFVVRNTKGKCSDKIYPTRPNFGNL